VMDEKTYLNTKAKYDCETGVLEINIPDIIADLPNEDRAELAKLHLWDSILWQELKNSVTNEYTTESYNSSIHRLRIEILTGEGAEKMIKNTISGILSDQKSAAHYSKKYRDALWKLERWCSDNLTWDQREGMPRMERGKDYPPSVGQAEIDDVMSKIKGK